MGGELFDPIDDHIIGVDTLLRESCEFAQLRVGRPSDQYELASCELRQTPNNSCIFYSDKEQGYHRGLYPTKMNDY
jgi:hypothetical protein